jgi:hypothetical protein
MRNLLRVRSCLENLFFQQPVKDDLNCRREKGSEETKRKLVGGTMEKKLFAELVESMQQHVIDAAKLGTGKA